MFDHLATVEGSGITASYAYDGLERLSERKGSGGTQVIHYGNLSDMPTYIANGEGETTTSYVQGAHGLVEQRSGEATDYPLADGHGNITAISGPAGGVESRQEYGPWGKKLSGPSLEMGNLGAWERPTDPATGLTRMGARTYDASLGTFASEDWVFGYLGIGASFNRYLYRWDDPVNTFDLTGRFPSFNVPGTPIEIHIPIPTPRNPVPEVPVSIEGLPNPAHWINSQIPNPSFEKTGKNSFLIERQISVKTAKSWLSHINLDPFWHKGCEKKYIASTDSFFPCLEEGGAPEEGSDSVPFLPAPPPQHPVPVEPSVPRVPSRRQF